MGVILGDALVHDVMVLILTALLTGILVPLIKGRMDDRKFRQQKLFEADLARQEEIIKSQVKLLEDLAGLLWGYEYLALKVSYYYGENNTRFKQAAEEFHEISWESMRKIRTEISKARRLTSPATYQELYNLYSWLGRTDRELVKLIQNEEATLGDWSKRHETFLYETGRKIDDTLAFLARDLRLASNRAGSTVDTSKDTVLPADNARKELES